MELTNYLPEKILELLKGYDVSKSIVKKYTNYIVFENDTLLKHVDGYLTCLCVSNYHKKFSMNQMSGNMYSIYEFVFNTETHNWMLVEDCILELKDSERLVKTDL
ncbi:hypothetical protein EB118_12990 [bacterium]|nr:hypothetical protein [Actinomycetota bacterium]NDG30973.1 hypothetical protein [bacterium]